MIDCDHCGKEFNPMHSRQRFCSRMCSNKHKREEERKVRDNSSFFPEVTKWKPRERAVLETDAQQKVIVDKLNKKWSIPPGKVKIMKPGTKEFNDAMKQIVNIDDIKRSSEHLIKQVNDLW